MGYRIWVHNRACWLNNYSPRSNVYITSSKNRVKERRR
jgi:hypothetical protein